MSKDRSHLSWSPGDIEWGAEKKPKKNAEKMPLYAYRPVRNAKAIMSWMKEQGLPVVGHTLHVTIAYSKEPVDWIEAGNAWMQDENGNMMIHPGGPRVLEKFDDCLVLSFASAELSMRHGALRNIGCSHDYEKYQPHITLCYETPPNLDLTKITPYTGAIALGPECFERIV